MTEEEYFRKTYPGSCYGDRLLSPYWDFFQDGVEFAERQAEERIADIKANCDLAIEGRDVKIMELEKENAELKETLKTYNGCGDWDNDFHTCRVYLQHEELQKYVEQLTKAKEIIKKFTEFVNNEIEYAPEHPQEHTDLWNGLCKQAEQFLKGENTILEDARAGNSPFDADEVFNKEMKAYPNRKVK